MRVYSSFFNTYLVKDVICAIVLRRRHMMAHIPALFTNELSSIAWSYISHASSWLHCVHLGMNIGTDLIRKFFTKLLALSWASLRRATTVGDDRRSFRFVNNHKWVLL